MGFFGDLWDGACSMARTAWSKAKEIAGKAIGWMAEKAEGFVNDVKKVWQAVKPYVTQIRVALLLAAKAVAVFFPWLSVALIWLEKVLGALTAFENSPIAKLIDAAIKWVIELAKRWQQSRQTERQTEAKVEDSETHAEGCLSDEELVTARRHQENLRFAEREVVAPEHRHQLELAAAINDYEIARADLAKAIDAAPENFEHYLRLRATQKLLSMADKKFRTAQSVDDLSADDLFLVRIASDLIKANGSIPCF